MIKGYLNREEATAEAIQDGWFRTGDIARIDEDGFVYIVDRAKDMVLRGGENVYCSEVEAAIYRNDDVAEAAVFGVPDDRLGEIVAAAIVPKPGASIDEGALVEELRNQIAAFKVPKRIWILDEPFAGLDAGGAAAAVAAGRVEILQNRENHPLWWISLNLVKFTKLW